jgi:uncharacterized membrane protein YjjB (DUF3815 family)
LPRSVRAATLVGQGFTPLLEDLGRPARTFVAALGVGTLGTLLARRSRLPAAIWTVPAILPLLPPRATLLPLLAESPEAQDALQSQAVETAFAIGVGVASGSIALAAYPRNRARLLKPVAKLSGRLARPVSRRRRRSTS